jgi:hypothetical protein
LPGQQKRAATPSSWQARANTSAPVIGTSSRFGALRAAAANSGGTTIGALFGVVSTACASLTPVPAVTAAAAPALATAFWRNIRRVTETLREGLRSIGCSTDRTFLNQELRGAARKAAPDMNVKAPSRMRKRVARGGTEVETVKGLRRLGETRSN